MFERHFTPQLALFPDSAKESAPEIKRRGRGKAGSVSDEALQARRDSSAEARRAKAEATALDRVHAAMLLQRSGRANALSALYPKASEEKRLLDAMLLAVPR